MNTRTPSNLRPAFSLVELLVVISIVALLLSLTLPALSKSRESGRTIVCASNLRQQYLLVTSYVNDQRDGAFPQSTRWSAAWMVRMTPYLGWPYKSGYTTTNDARYTTDGRLSGWAADSECPDRKYPIFSCPTTKGFPRPGYWGQSYGYNLTLTSGRPDDVSANVIMWPRRRTMYSIKWKPSNIVLTADCYISSFMSFGDFNNSLVEPTGPRVHDTNLRINIQFVDGHVAITGRGERNDINYDDAMPTATPPAIPGWQ